MSFTSTALAFAISEGLVDLADTAISHFRHFADEITDPGSHQTRTGDPVVAAPGARPMSHSHDTVRARFGARQR